jgi:hypothetical protein
LASTNFLGDAHCARTVAAPNAANKTVGRSVGKADRVGFIFQRHDREYRPKNLVAGPRV